MTGYIVGGFIVFLVFVVIILKSRSRNSSMSENIGKAVTGNRLAKRTLREIGDIIDDMQNTVDDMRGK